MNENFSIVCIAFVLALIFMYTDFEISYEDEVRMLKFCIWVTSSMLLISAILTILRRILL